MNSDQHQQGGAMRSVKIAAIVAPYLAAVVAANLIVNHYGPASTPYVSFVLIGGVLIFRDAFASLVNPRSLKGIAAQVLLVAAGSLLTFLVNQDALFIAKASVVAFAASELVEQVLYAAMSDRPWLDRAPLSATVGAAVDSVLFITLAFGFSFRIAFLQWVAKTAGGYLWARLFQAGKDRREVLAGDA